MKSPVPTWGMFGTYAHGFCLSDDLEEETGFVWDGIYTYIYTYIYTDSDSYDPLTQVRNWTNEDGKSRQQTRYFHCDQISILRDITDIHGNLLLYGEYTAWGHLKEETKVADSAYQPFRLQNQYCDRETGLHYNFFRCYEPDAGRFVKQDPILLLGGSNLYSFTSNTNTGWNLTPAKHPHTGTIHGTGSALRTHLPYSTPTGIINYIVPR